MLGMKQKSKTKQVVSTGSQSATNTNPFGIKNSGGYNIGQQMLKRKAGVRSAVDKRKSVRIPVELYKEATKGLGHGERSELLATVLNDFMEEYEKKGVQVLQSSEGQLETRPIKISEETFRILKVIRFETDYTNTDIIASALKWYLHK